MEEGLSRNADFSGDRILTPLCAPSGEKPAPCASFSSAPRAPFSTANTVWLKFCAKLREVN
jgi:hypothetical protein